MSLPLGLIQWTEGTTGTALVDNLRRLEALGYHECWIPELAGREVMGTCGYLLGRTERIRVSSGIANVYARDADAAAQAATALAEFSGGRFSLGLGVSHPLLVEPRGHTWEKPVPKMRAYLERLQAVEVACPPPRQPAPVIVAAHGPGLLKIAAELADGAFLFLQPAATVRRARERLGPERPLHVVVRCALAADPDAARDLARRACAFYISLPAYHAAWGRAGFEPADWETGGSDRLIDAICAWGDVQRIRQQVALFEQAGASHIVLYPCHPEEDYSPTSAVSALWDWKLLEALAPAA